MAAKDRHRNTAISVMTREFTNRRGSVGATSAYSSRTTRSDKKRSSMAFMKIFDCSRFNESKKICYPKKLSEVEYLIRHDNRLIILYFGAKWCGACKVFLPKLDTWAGDYPEVVFCKIDVDKHEDIADELDIQSLPTILFFKNERSIEIVRGADIKLTLNTIQKNRDVPGGDKDLRPITSNDEFRYIVEREKGPVVILVQDKATTSLEPVMRTLAGQVPYMLVCRVDADVNKETARKLDVQEMPSVAVFLDDRLLYQMKKPKEDAIRKMFRLMRKPSLLHNDIIILKSEVEYNTVIQHSGKDLVVIYFFADYCGYCKKLDQVVKTLAETYQEATFCKFDIEDAKDFIQRVGLKKVPTFHLYKNQQMLEEVVGSKERHLRKAIHKHK